MFCKNCGKEVPDIINYCPKCGFKLKTNAEDVPKNTIDFTNKEISASLRENNEILNGKLTFYGDHLSFSYKSFLKEINLDIEYCEIKSVELSKRVPIFSHGFAIITEENEEIRFITSRNKAIKKYLDWKC